ncbi:hypothetical protein [Kiloniella litopenaei]|uniref:hypothetical protein n=1 Tax=Kiloniella litopenaei TaxID=1549748 RepID=UPI003BA8D0EA
MKKTLSYVAISLLLTGCAASGYDSLRSTYYSLAYTKGDALLAANGQAIKVNVVSKDGKEALEKNVSTGLNKYGPKWLDAKYAPASTIQNKSPYQMKWAFNVPESGNAISICGEDYDSNPENFAIKNTSVVLAAFCVDNRTLTSLRARVYSAPDTEEFSKTIGLIGRKLLTTTNPERFDDCTNFDDCT